MKAHKITWLCNSGTVKGALGVSWCAPGDAVDYVGTLPGCRGCDLLNTADCKGARQDRDWDPKKEGDS